MAGFFFKEALMILYDENFERIYQIISDFIKISEKYNGKPHIFIRKLDAGKSKHWNYFKKLDEWSLEGRIVLPDYIEAQFASPRWTGIKIYPNQLISQRALDVWARYVKDRGIKKRDSESSTLIYERAAEIIMCDMRDARMIEALLNKDGKVDVKEYLKQKIIVKDYVFYAFIILTCKQWEEFYQKEKERIRLLWKERKKEIKELKAADKDIKKYKRFSKFVYQSFLRVIGKIVKIKKEEGGRQ